MRHVSEQCTDKACSAGSHAADSGDQIHAGAHERAGAARLSAHFSGADTAPDSGCLPAALPGFALEDCPPLFGDTIERTVTWKNGGDVSSIVGKPVRLRFVMKDADVYALRFAP
ncbi:MAG TPA: hypothetical protein DDZ88_15565 [Verrucomicrobiales bacterium]|nr:hypothetical protein [Verrucomicrobiales bacterium]